MQEKNKSRSSLKNLNRSKESEKSFSYNNDDCEKTDKRSRGRPPLKEAKNENSNTNDFSLDFALDLMLLM
jgi:hypothetical protein